MDPQNNPQPTPPAQPQVPDTPETIPQWTYQSGQLQQVQPIGPAPDQPLVQNEALPQEPQPTPQLSEHDEPLVSWAASEFLTHEKQKSWYALLVVATIVLAAVAFLITRDIMSIIVILVFGLAFGVFGAKKPRELPYALFEDGFQVGDKRYGYIDFRSFTLLDSAIPSIQLLPQKRFMVAMVLYCAPEDVDKIVDTLGQFLPYEQRSRDWVDKFTTKIRF